MERRHLVIVHQRGWADLEDWRAIARHVGERAADLHTFIVDNESADARLAQAAATAPTLVVSPGPLRAFRPARGKVYAGWRVPKSEQLRRLSARGLPVPQWRLFRPGQVFRAKGWPPLVVVKPADGLSSDGSGVRLFDSGRIDGKVVNGLVESTGAAGRAYLVQAFVDGGPCLDYRRVLTLFGRPLYSARETLREPLALEADGAPVRSGPIANNGFPRAMRRFDLVAEPDALALASACHEAVPECPLKGVDLLRCRSTGALYVLELNPGGNTWAFSSAHVRRQGGEPDFERARRDQFDAFSVAADVLIERTRAEAA